MVTERFIIIKILLQPEARAISIGVLYTLNIFIICFYICLLFNFFYFSL